MFNKILIILLFLNLSLHSQNSDLEYGVYNIGIGAFFGGIGGMINKTENQTLGNSFIKGFCNGAIGGYVTFESKRLLRLAVQEQDWKLFWASNILNAAGTSLKENAAMNKKLWNHWHLNFGFNRLEINLKEDKVFRYKIMPISFSYITWAMFNEKFDIGRTLKYGQFYFWFNRTENLGYHRPGYIAINSKFLDSNIPLEIRYEQLYEIIGHEIVHVYQTNDFLPINSTYQNYLKNDILKISKFEKFLYLDFQHLLYFSLYSFNQNHDKNFFENEARYFSN
ncbi:MAG: hypothetical protein ACK4JX_03135 [Flavobacterium sp.]